MEQKLYTSLCITEVLIEARHDLRLTLLNILSETMLLVGFPLFVIL